MLLASPPQAFARCTFVETSSKERSDHLSHFVWVFHEGHVGGARNLSHLVGGQQDRVAIRRKAEDR